MKKSFDEWFVGQFGKRPTTVRPAPLLLKIRELREDLKATEELHRRAEIWDEQERAARQGWNAKENNS